MEIFGTRFAFSCDVKKCFFILLAGFFLGISPAKSEPDPFVQQLHTVALQQAGLETRHIGQWRKKIRRAAWLPRLQVGVDRSLHNDVDVRVQDSVSVSSGGVVVGPESTQQMASQNRNINFGVKAVWDLGATIFSYDDLRVSQEARSLSMERERILTRVNENYFEWLKAKAATK